MFEYRPAAHEQYSRNGSKPSVNHSRTSHSVGPTSLPSSVIAGASPAPPVSVIIAMSADGEPSDCSIAVISACDPSVTPPLAARSSTAVPPNSRAVVSSSVRNWS